MEINVIPDDIRTVDEFQKFAINFQEEHEMPYAFGLGINYKNSGQNTIAVKWLTVNVQENMGTASAVMKVFGIELGSDPFYGEFTKEDAQMIVRRYFNVYCLDGKYHENICALKLLAKNTPAAHSYSVIFYKDESCLLHSPISSIGDAHFRLALMSRSKYKPNTLCLDKMFNILPTLVYTDYGVYEVEEYNQKIWGGENCSGVVVDKTPPLLWGAPIPLGIIISNPYSIRLGQYLMSEEDMHPNDSVK